MDALAEVFYFFGVTLRALRRSNLRRDRYFVMISVAGLAGLCAKRAVRAGGYVRRFVGVAGCALNLRNLGRVRIVLDGGVAIGATENSMDAGRMFNGVN